MKTRYGTHGQRLLTVEHGVIKGVLALEAKAKDLR